MKRINLRFGIPSLDAIFIGLVEQSEQGKSEGAAQEIPILVTRSVDILLQ